MWAAGRARKLRPGLPDRWPDMGPPEIAALSIRTFTLFYTNLIIIKHLASRLSWVGHSAMD
jgi:hypothetical protein